RSDREDDRTLETVARAKARRVAAANLARVDARAGADDASGAHAAASQVGGLGRRVREDDVGAPKQLDLVLHRVVAANQAPVRLAEVDERRDQEGDAGRARVAQGWPEQRLEGDVHPVDDVESTGRLPERQAELGGRGGV